MEKKMTKKDVINMMLAVEEIRENEIFKNYLEHELELLAKKSASKKATKNQTENEETKKLILGVLKTMEKGTVTEIQKADETLEQMSNQKISALLRQLAENGLVVREMEKRKAYFSLVQ